MELWLPAASNTPTAAPAMIPPMAPPDREDPLLEGTGMTGAGGRKEGASSGE